MTRQCRNILRYAERGIMGKRLRSLSCILACVLLLSGCGHTEQTEGTDPATAQEQTEGMDPATAQGQTEEADPATTQEQAEGTDPATAQGQGSESQDAIQSEKTGEEEDKAYLFDADLTYQTIDGFGAAYTWYANWINFAEDPEEIMDALFSDAKLTVLRLKNEYEYEAEGEAPNVYTMVQYYAAARERAEQYGEEVKVLLCCWSPPADLKEGGDITGAASLRKKENGEYCYEEYAAWWAEAIAYYRDYGIQVDYISIQNEVEFAASYDGCVFAPQETEDKASFEKAYLAVYDELQRQFGESAPKMLGPETMSCRYGDIFPYMKGILEDRPETVYGIAHHLYVGGDGDNDANTVNPSSFTTQFMSLREKYGNIARWQTEYYVGHAIDTATIINNALIYEDLNCYLYWSGVWDDNDSGLEGGYLIGVKYQKNTPWRRKADYYAVRHFSEFIRPGYLRMDTKSQSLSVNTSGFISPEGDKAVLVLINNGEEEMRYRLEPSHYIVENAVVYQSVFGKTCTSEDGLYQNLGDIGPEGTLVLPAGSVTTVDITGKRQ